MAGILPYDRSRHDAADRPQPTLAEKLDRALLDRATADVDKAMKLLDTTGPANLLADELGLPLKGSVERHLSDALERIKADAVLLRHAKLAEDAIAQLMGQGGQAVQP